MAYSTGTGDYAAMMAAVLAHAVTDGWLEVGGVSSGWPIKNAAGTMFVDFTTSTFVENDVTLGGDGIPKTQRLISLGMSHTSGAAATTNSSGSVARTVSAGYASLNFHIFSEPAVSDHVMIAFVFSNGVDPEVCSHFGFGDLDHAGMTHGLIQFCGGQEGRGWAATGGNGAGAGDWNSLNRTKLAYAGTIGQSDDASSNMMMIINTTNHPIPGTPGTGWPNVDTWMDTSTGLVWKMSRPGIDNQDPQFAPGNSCLNWHNVGSEPQPHSGSVTLMPLPIFILNGSGVAGSMFLAGFIPSTRLCSVTGFSVGDEVSFSGDTWKVFPMVKKTDNSLLNTAFIVTSGSAGYAYKKVV